MSRHFILATLAWTFLGGTAASARAADESRAPATAATTATANADGLAERTRLRAELDRLNAEIDALKRGHRNVGSDYQLRRKLADAEDRARRLTALEARIKGVNVTPVSPLASLTPAPVTEPSDDREVLEAKADILADQARKLDQQAELLEVRIANLRDRQELRRRVNHLDHDPFSPLEQSKRRVTFGSGQLTGNTGTSSKSAGGAQSESNGSGPAGPTSGPSSVVSTGATDRGTNTGFANTTSTAPTPVPVAVSGATSDASGSLASQFRGVLDPVTLAEIRRLEADATGVARLPAAEKTLAALRQRARQLQSDAEAARKNAQIR